MNRIYALLSLSVLISTGGCSLKFSRNPAVDETQSHATSSASSLPAAPTCVAVASPASIAPGASSTLTLTASGTVTSTLLAGQVSTAATQTIVVRPTNNTSYGGSVTGPGGTSECDVSVQVAAGSSPTCSLFANPSSVTLGQNSTLTLTTSAGTASATINGTSVSAGGGSLVVTPSVTTMYSAAVTGPSGTGTCSANVVVTTPPAAPTCTLTASPTSIAQGSLSTLTLITSAGTTSATLNGSSFSAAGGTLTVTPSLTTVYSATVNNSGGSGNCSTTVTVTTGPPSGPAPTCTVTASPNAVVSGQSTAVIFTPGQSANAATFNGTNVSPNVPTTISVAPATTATYSGSVSGTTGSSNCSTTVVVAPPLSLASHNVAEIFPQLPYCNASVTDVAYNSGRSYAICGTSLYVSSAPDQTFVLNQAAGQSVQSLFVSGGSVYLGTIGAVNLSTDGGGTFAGGGNTGLVSLPVAAVAASTSWVVALLTSQQGNSVFMSPNQSALSFSRVVPQGNPSKIGLVGNNLLVLTTAGLQLSSNSGQTFTTVEPSATSFAISGNNVLIGTPTGIKFSSDAGNTISINTALGYPVMTTFLNAQYMLIIDGSTGSYGSQISADGTHFSAVHSSLPSVPNRIFMVNNNLFALCQGVLYVSADMGYTFLRYYQNGLEDIYADDAGNLFASTDFGLLVSQNGGQSFTSRTSASGAPPSQEMRIGGIASGPVFLLPPAFNGAGLWSTSDHGTTFSPVTAAGAAGQPSGPLSIIGNSLLFASAVPWQVESSTNGGATFATLPSSGLNNFSDIAGYQNTIVAAANYLYISSNGGTTFTRSNDPAFTVDWYNYTFESVFYDTTAGCMYAGTLGGDGVLDGAIFVSCGGGPFTKLWSSNTHGSGPVTQIYVHGQSIYALWENSLVVSTDGGAHFVVYGASAGITSARRLSVNSSTLFLTTSLGYLTTPLPH